MYCSDTLVIHELTKHLLSACTKFPVICTNRGCETQVLRSELCQHISNDCLFLTIPCPLFTAGIEHGKCSGTIKRRDIKSHGMLATTIKPSDMLSLAFQFEQAKLIKDDSYNRDMTQQQQVLHLVKNTPEFHELIGTVLEVSGAGIMNMNGTYNLVGLRLGGGVFERKLPDSSKTFQITKGINKHTKIVAASSAKFGNNSTKYHCSVVAVDGSVRSDVFYAVTEESLWILSESLSHEAIDRDYQCYLRSASWNSIVPPQVGEEYERTPTIRWMRDGVCINEGH